MRYLLTISLFVISIALGAWGYFLHKEAVEDRNIDELKLQDNSPGLLIASLIVGAGALGSLQLARRRHRQQLRRGDIGLLSKRLISMGIEEVDIEELHAALKADPPLEIVRKRFSIKTIAEWGAIGEQLSAWIKKTTASLAEQYPDNTARQLEQLVPTPILEYYGWD